MRVVALAFLALACAQPTLFSFSGNFSTLRQKLTPNEIDYNGACGYSSSQYLYTTFNFTFATAGVRGVYGANLVYVGVSQDMTGFLPNTLCANNAVYPLKQTALGFTAGIGPEYAFGGWFEAGTYTFVIAGDGGPFVGEIKESQIQGETTTAKSWEPIKSDSGSTTCDDTFTGSYYDAKLYTATRTGYHTLYLTLAQNKTGIQGYQYPSGYAVLTILKGDYTASVGTLRCANVTNDYVISRRGTNGALNVQAYNAVLTSGVTYTIIASGGDIYSGTDGYVGKYGVAITAGTKYDFSPGNDVFLRPASDSCTVPSQCVPAYQEQGNNYARVTFTVPKNTFYWVHSDHSSAALYNWYFYNENNVNKSTCGTSFNCVAVEDFLPGKFFFSGDSQNFTVYSTGQVDQAVFSEGYIFFYVMGGASITVTPTNAPTTVAPTTKQPTVPPTTATPTTPGTTRAPTTNTPTVAGTTRAPTTAAPTTAGNTDVSSAAGVSMALSVCIAMLVLA